MNILIFYSSQYIKTYSMYFHQKQYLRPLHLEILAMKPSSLEPVHSRGLPILWSESQWCLHIK